MLLLWNVKATASVGKSTLFSLSSVGQSSSVHMQLIDTAAGEHSGGGDIYVPIYDRPLPCEHHSCKKCGDGETVECRSI